MTTAPVTRTVMGRQHDIDRKTEVSGHFDRVDTVDDDGDGGPAVGTDDREPEVSRLSSRNAETPSTSIAQLGPTSNSNSSRASASTPRPENGNPVEEEDSDALAPGITQQVHSDNKSTHLPEELMAEIIDNVAVLPNADAFSYEPEVIKALCSLCLVSSNVRHWALRHLYRHVTITSRHQLQLFVGVGIPYCCFTRSLALLDPKTHDPKPLAVVHPLHPPTNDSELRSYAISKPASDFADHLVMLFTGIQKTNRRLMIDGLTALLWSSRSLRFGESSSIQQLGLVFDFFDTPEWQDWSNVHTLIVMTPICVPLQLPAFQTVEVLTLVWDVPVHEPISSVGNLICSLPLLRMLRLICTAHWHGIEGIVTPWTSEARHELATMYADRTRIVDLRADFGGRSPQDWLRESVLWGTIWSVPEDDWLDALEPRISAA